MPRMTNPKIIDIDAILAEEEDEAAPTVKVKLLGREWDFQTGVNTFTFSAIMAGDVGAMSQFIVNSVVEEQRTEFGAALMKMSGMTPKKLNLLLSSIVEAVAERPTKQPSASSRPVTKRTSAPKSRAR